jgi:hypothetical protein
MKLGDTITFDFATNNPNTGEVQDTDSLPTCEVFENEFDVPVFIPDVIQRVGKLGNYRVSIETFESNGFKINVSYNVIVEATVENVTTKSRIGFFFLNLMHNEELSEVISQFIQPKGY